MARRKLVIAPRSLSPFTMEKQNCCPVCYEDYDNVEAGVCRVHLEQCGHDFCKECLEHHCLLTIQEHKELPVTCPLSSCDASIARTQVHDMLCSEACDDPMACQCKPWIKYQRRLQMTGDLSLVPCTNCEALLSKVVGDNLTCPCGHSFCAVHGDAHPNMTCKEYESRPPSPEEQLSQNTVNDTTKPCPHCNARIELYGGCEHIVCTSCHNDWCYKCGQYQYLVGNTIRTCTLCQQSYMDHRKLERQRVKACLRLPFTLPMALLYIVVATASAMASGCCCLFFGCGVFVGDDEELRPPSPQKGMRMTLIYLVWPLLDILTDFGVPVYNGWLVKGIEQELGIASSTTSSSSNGSSTSTLEESTVAEDEMDDLSVLSN